MPWKDVFFNFCQLKIDFGICLKLLLSKLILYIKGSSSTKKNDISLIWFFFIEKLYNFVNFIIVWGIYTNLLLFNDSVLKFVRDYNDYGKAERFCP